MKKFTAFAIIFFLSTPFIFSENTEVSTPFTSYRPVYLTLGNGEILESYFGKQLVKVGFSVKYQFFNEYKTGFYLSYTQIMFWDLFGPSNPFTEINFNPEAFYRFESGKNMFGDAVIPAIDFIQGGYEHKSNGRGGDDSRGWDRIYAELQLGVGDIVHAYVGTRYFVMFDVLYPQVFGITYVSDNPDIQKYIGSTAFTVGISIEENIPVPFLPQEIILSFGPGGGINGFDFAKGWQQLDLIFMEAFGGAHLYAQLYNGYGESLIGYDEDGFSARIGVLLR